MGDRERTLRSRRTLGLEVQILLGQQPIKNFSNFTGNGKERLQRKPIFLVKSGGRWQTFEAEKDSNKFGVLEKKI